jgi:hypothetical protein
LVGFQKTNVLKPGQSQHITILTPVSSLEIWDPNAMKDVVYNGSYAFNVGASSTDIRGTAAVKVSGSIAPQVQTVTVQPDQSSLQAGQTIDLTGKNPWIADDTTGVGSVSQGRNMSVTADNIVEAANNDGSFADLTKAHVFYTSSDPRVATVNSKGLVTAVGDGAADITVTVNGVSGSAPIVVGHAVSVSAPALTQAGHDVHQHRARWWGCGEQHCHGPRSAQRLERDGDHPGHVRECAGRAEGDDDLVGHRSGRAGGHLHTERGRHRGRRA